MITMYIGVFGNILKAFLNAVMKPVFQFLGQILSAVLGFIFDQILTPILTEVFVPIVEILLESLITAMAGVFYEILVRMLKIIDVIEMLFDVLMGARPVTLNGGQSGSIITVLLTSGTVRKTYFMILAFSIALLFAFSIYAVARSAADFDFNGKKPISKVLRLTVRAFGKLLLLHAMIVIFAYLGQTILSGIKLAFTNADSDSTIGTQLYLIATLNAANKNANVRDYKYNQEYRDNPKMDDGLRKLFLGGENARYDYGNSSVCIGSYETDDARPVYVKKERRKGWGMRGSGGGYRKVSSEYGLFILSDVDYILGIISAAAVLMLMAMCMVLAVGRIFEMIVLMLVSPFFVATMPIDDGKFLKSWTQSFSGKMFSAYGGYLSMRLYVTLIPIMSFSFTFVRGSATLDGVAKLLFVCGGAWGVYKSFTLLTYFFDTQTAEHDAATAGMAGGFVYSQFAKLGRSTGAAAWKGVKNIYNTRKALKENAEQQHQGAEEAFRGGKSQGGEKGAAGSESKRALKGTRLYTGGNINKMGETEHKFMCFRWTKDKSGKTTSFSVPLLFRVQSRAEKDKDGKETGNRVTSFGFFGRTGREDGGALTFNVKKDKNKKVVGGGMSLAGIAKYDSSNKNGKSLSLLGKVDSGKGVFNISKDSGAKKLSKVRIAGQQFERQADGKMRNTDFMNGMIKTSYTKDANNNVTKAYQTTRFLFGARSKFYSDPEAKTSFDAAGKAGKDVQLQSAEQKNGGSGGANNNN